MGMFTSTKTPSRQEAAATLRHELIAAIQRALDHKVHKLDAADLLETEANNLRLRHQMTTAP
jgi:hypothetical protein